MTFRNGAGHLERDTEQARIDAEAAELRSQRISYPEIARRQGCAVSTAYERVKRAIAAVPYEAVEELRRVELASLDELEQEALKVLRTEHLKVDHGKVIMVDGKQLLDDAPVLNAIVSILRIKQQRMKLVPELEAPRRSEVTVHDGDSDLDREIAELLAGMGRLEEGTPAVEAPGTTEPADA